MSKKIDLFSQFTSVPEAMKWSKALVNLTKPFIQHNGACVVIDIDGTLLNPNTLRAIKPVVDFAQHVFQQRIPIHIVTARVDVGDNRSQTIQQLANIGLRLRSGANSRLAANRVRPVALYETLSMRSMRDFQSNNFSGFKYRVRCNLPEPVLINIGDQWDDLIRRPPHSRTKREQHLSDLFSRLPARNTYVGQLSDCSWFSVKVPS